MDYKKYKERFPLTCKKIDSASVIQSQHLLDSLVNYEIIDSRDMFYHDIGMTYYFRFAYWENKSDLRTALEYFEKGFEEFKNSDFARELTLYAHLGECDKALNYLNSYLDLAKNEGVKLRTGLLCSEELL